MNPTTDRSSKARRYSWRLEICKRESATSSTYQRRSAQIRSNRQKYRSWRKNKMESTDTTASSRPQVLRSIKSKNSRDNGHGNGPIHLKVCHGDYVELENGSLGTIRYIGTPLQTSNHSHTCWFGISLSDAIGKHNGSFKHITFWRDKPKHGIFVQSSQISKIIKSMSMRNFIFFHSLYFYLFHFVSFRFSSFVWIEYIPMHIA